MMMMQTVMIMVMVDNRADSGDNDDDGDHRAQW